MNETLGWKEFFDEHAPKYGENRFTKNTTAEVDFLTDVLGIAPGARVLDVGCGTGRHSVELARRGYRVTGVDISPGMLAEAQRAADQAGVEVEWICSDATRFRSDKLFDAAICLCEGAFGLLGVDDDPAEHDLAILRNIHAALRPSAGFLLTCLNGFAKIRRFSQEDVDSGKFDPLTLTEYVDDVITPDVKKHLRAKERGFLPQQLEVILAQAGFKIDNMWGGTAGDWGRRPIRLDEIEIMVVARKV